MAILSTSAVNEVKNALDAQLDAERTAGFAVGGSFCEIWPQAKPILEVLATVAIVLPGVGAGASAVLKALIAVGENAYQKTCS